MVLWRTATSSQQGLARPQDNTIEQTRTVLLPYFIYDWLNLAKLVTEKNLKGEQKQVVAHSADCGEAPRWEFAAYLQNRVFMGGCGGERTEEGKRGERRGRSGPETEDRQPQQEN